MNGNNSTAPELLMVVDEEDRFLEEKEKWECHRGDGILHRAFVVMVINGEGEILLARRSPGKRLWPGFWDGTVASHVHVGESYEEAAARRLTDELGIEGADVTYVTKFTYQAGYGEAGSEREVCAVLVTSRRGPWEIRPQPEEIDEVCYVPPARVASMEKVAPWLTLALALPEVSSYLCADALLRPPMQ